MGCGQSSAAAGDEPKGKYAEPAIAPIKSVVTSASVSRKGSMRSSCGSKLSVNDEAASSHGTNSTVGSRALMSARGSAKSHGTQRSNMSRGTGTGTGTGGTNGTPRRVVGVKRQMKNAAMRKRAASACVEATEPPRAEIEARMAQVALDAVKEGIDGSVPPTDAAAEAADGARELGERGQQRLAEWVQRIDVSAEQADPGPAWFAGAPDDRFESPPALARMKDVETYLCGDAHDIDPLDGDESEEALDALMMAAVGGSSDFDPGAGGAALTSENLLMLGSRHPPCRCVALVHRRLYKTNRMFSTLSARIL
jgi:hypothetical protein